MIGLQECGLAPPRAPVNAGSGSKARERRVQALDYYNTHVHKAWTNAGLSASRSSFNDRHRHNSNQQSSSTNNHHHHHHHNHQTLYTKRTNNSPPEHLYRSNSSLELLDYNGRLSDPSSPVLRREYGSHGSIDINDQQSSVHHLHQPPQQHLHHQQSSSQHVGDSYSFFAMLRNYHTTMFGVNGTADQRSPGPSEYLRSKLDMVEGAGGNDESDGQYMASPQSPKLRVKLSKFFVSNGQGQQRHTLDDAAGLSMMTSTSSSSSSNCGVSTAHMILSIESEEIARRRAFAHYDCQSLTTNLNYTANMRRMLAKRRNTTTGASAASMMSRAATPDGECGNGSGDEDAGDGQTNELVQSCPFFRNEVGGEEERIVSLTRLQNGQNGKRVLHRPPLAYGVAVLEFPYGETHWRHSTCPYQRLPRPIESVDQGALYYRNYFLGQEHQNWFGMDEQLGPIAISIRREKVQHSALQSTTSTTNSGSSTCTSSSNPLMQYQYRLVVRTSELQTLRGAILEDAIPNIKSSNNSKTLNVKDVLEYVAPEIQLNCLRMGVQNHQTEEQLLKLDEQGLTNHYKVGVMYCKAGQCTEEEMYNNEDAGPAFAEFLETIGKKVRLNGFNKYRAGLDNKTDSTGLYSIYSQYQDCEIMFHVSTMLPFTKNNRQQLLRKRHIGNDIVTIVFQEPDALPFTPKGLRSHFQHVFIVVQAINPNTENTHYKVAVSRSKDVEVFGPPIKDGAIFPKGKAFADFLLAKIVNAENAAHRSDKFVSMATRTRQEYLKDLVANYSTSTPVDTGQKFSIFSSKKKDKIRPRFIPDACQRGAILWQVLLNDGGQSILCFLGISTDTLVLIEETTKQIVFVTPCKSILGWSSQSNDLRIYHHQGECITITMRDTNGDRDELMEIMERLKCVTHGVQVQELPLNRNIMGQLGFHVQPDGIVTLVESAGQAWQAGLRQNSRLVEICKAAVSTLTYDQMVDLLKTSLVVTLAVIPPLPDGSPRKGCTLQNCKYNEGNYEGDYENLDDANNKTRKAPQMQQAVPGNHRKIYERSFSPPRSSNSSGYGTGSSSKSFHTQEPRFANPEGTMTSSSSGLSGDEKWYDFLQEFEPQPPPVPLKGGRNTNNTFPTTPKRNNNNNNHAHFVPHSKIQVSHSLPLQHVTYNQPMTAVVHDYDQFNNTVVARTPKITEFSTIHNDLNRQTDNHSTDSSISERLYGIGSEDELSNGSGNVSPKMRRGTKTIVNSSRNQSPRSMNGETKLRAGVSTARSSNRNSANINNNIQEELIRLINPDNIEGNGDNMKSRNDNLHKTQPEVILTMARPATVISNASTTSSPLPNEFKSKKNVEEFALPDDWSSFVDTTARVMMQVGEGANDDKRHWGDEEVTMDASITSSVISSTSVPELQSHVTELQSKVNRETRRRLSLENEVRRLKEENSMLRNQAQAAVQQLRKFTEWFFKNVQKQ